MAGHYTVQETADAAGLSVQTPLRLHLVRNHRPNPMRRFLRPSLRPLPRAPIFHTSRVGAAPRPRLSRYYQRVAQNSYITEEQLARIRDTISLLDGDIDRRRAPCRTALDDASARITGGGQDRSPS
jgi:hypothetical protein